MWTCPNCDKKFRNVNQWHSCYKSDIDTHFRNKDERVRIIYDKLIDEISKFGKFDLNPVKSAIQFKSGATFLSVKAKKNHIEMEFQLEREYVELPVFRTINISSKRVLHYAAIEDVSDITKELLSLLNESYQLVSNRE